MIQSEGSNSVKLKRTDRNTHVHRILSLNNTVLPSAVVRVNFNTNLQKKQLIFQEEIALTRRRFKF